VPGKLASQRRHLGTVRSKRAGQGGLTDRSRPLDRIDLHLHAETGHDKNRPRAPGHGPEPRAACTHCTRLRQAGRERERERSVRSLYAQGCCCSRGTHTVPPPKIISLLNEPSPQFMLCGPSSSHAFFTTPPLRRTYLLQIPPQIPFLLEHGIGYNRSISQEFSKNQLNSLKIQWEFSSCPFSFNVRIHRSSRRRNEE
jgi:hypothetical protein